VLQIAPPGEEDLAASSIMTVELFATAMGAALAGMLANLGGLTSPGGVPGTSGAAQWLFVAFALAPALCLLTSRQTAKSNPPAIRQTADSAA
jgi:hypothetical protein